MWRGDWKLYSVISFEAMRRVGGDTIWLNTIMSNYLFIRFEDMISSGDEHGTSREMDLEVHD